MLRQKLLVVVSLLVALFCLCVVGVFGQHERHVASGGVRSDWKYGIMIDAGSSGTRLIVFTWPPHIQYGKLPAVQGAPVGVPVDDKWEMKIKAPAFLGGTGGLADYVSHPHLVGESLEQLLDFAKDKMKSLKKRWHEIPVYLKGTAGLRMAYENHPANTTLILQNLRNTCAKSGFYFADPSQVQIASGEDEGVFGWISVNVLADTLFAEKAANTWAVLDMGGASAQVTLYPGGSSPVSDSYLLEINENTKTLYTHSYLSYGQDQALFRLWNLLDSADISPCHWSGALVNGTKSNGKPIHIEGEFNYADCSELVKGQMLGLDAFCPFEPCGLNGEYQVAFPENMPIAMINGFVFTGQFFGFHGTYELGELRDAIKATCGSETWAQVKAANPNFPAQFLVQYCFYGTYYYNLMRFGYNIADDRKVTPLATVNGTSITWALGGMIYEAKLLSINLPAPVKPSSTLQHGVLINAGSSHTGIMAFKWPIRQDASSPNLECAEAAEGENCVEETLTTPLQNYYPNGAAKCAKEIFVPLLNAAQEHNWVPATYGDKNPTKLFVKATGVLRAMASNDPDGVDEFLHKLYNEVAKLDEAGAYDLHFEDWAVISGEEEAAFGWLSINVGQGGILQSRAVVDIGGSSMEITFLPEEIPMDHYFPVQMPENKRVALYAHSYASFGWNDAESRFLDAVATGAGGMQGGTKQTACLFEGFEQDVDGVTVEGSAGGFADCQESLAATNILELDGVYCAASPCGPNGVYQPSIPADMEVMRFYEEQDIMVLLGCGGVTTDLACLENAAKQICTQKWSKIKSDFPDVNPVIQKFMCFGATYIYELFTRGFGLDINHPISMDSPRDDWSFGAMYHEVTLLPIQIPERVFEEDVPAYMYAIGGGVFFVLVVASYYACKHWLIARHHDRRKEQEPLIYNDEASEEQRDPETGVLLDPAAE